MMRPLTPAKYASYWMMGLAAIAVALAASLYVGVGEPLLAAGHSRGPAVQFGFDGWESRLLRVLSAGLVGWALAASGVALQALLRNALADPYVLGISSGSSLGVMVWLLLTLPIRQDENFKVTSLAGTLLKAGETLPAMLGAGATCVIVFLLARGRRGGGTLDPLRLILVGVVISAINGALIMLLNNFAPGQVKIDLMRYMMGFVTEEWRASSLAIAGTLVLAAWLLLMVSARALNVSTLSEVEVASLGVRLGRLRTMSFIAAAVMTAVSIAVAGPIGFIGLICPHICRRLFGADHRVLIVMAPVCGAVVLMLADSFVRCNVFSFRTELPVGVITALAGGPFFLVLLLSGRGRAVDDGR